MGDAAKRLSGSVCPKCNGIRQWPMQCVVGYPEEKCEGKSVDLIGAKDFFGSAGPVKADAPMPDLAEIKPEPTPAPGGSLYEIAIKAIDLRSHGRPGFHVPARVIAELYADAVRAEMHDTVKAAVRLVPYGVSKLPLFPVDCLRAEIETRAAKGVASMVTNLGMRYMFDLHDAVREVINGFEPPEGAWVADDSGPQTESTTMDDTTQTAAEGAAAEGVAMNPAPASIPQLTVEDHALGLAKAAASVHYPELDSIERVEATAQNYMNDAKQFIAMFNTALNFLQAMVPNPQPAPQESAGEQNPAGT